MGSGHFQKKWLIAYGTFFGSSVVCPNQKELKTNALIKFRGSKNQGSVPHFICRSNLARVLLASLGGIITFVIKEKLLDHRAASHSKTSELLSRKKLVFTIKFHFHSNKPRLNFDGLLFLAHMFSLVGSKNKIFVSQKTGSKVLSNEHLSVVLRARNAEQIKIGFGHFFSGSDGFWPVLRLCDFSIFDFSQGGTT